MCLSAVKPVKLNGILHSHKSNKQKRHEQVRVEGSGLASRPEALSCAFSAHRHPQWLPLSHAQAQQSSADPEPKPSHTCGN